jgi:hypothetical protein
MKLTREQREKILRLFPKQRGNVKVDNSRFLDAVIYSCENGYKWPFLKPSALAYHLRQNQPLGKKQRVGTDISRLPRPFPPGNRGVLPPFPLRAGPRGNDHGTGLRVRWKLFYKSNGELYSWDYDELRAIAGTILPGY